MKAKQHFRAEFSMEALGEKRMKSDVFLSFTGDSIKIWARHWNQTCFQGPVDFDKAEVAKQVMDLPM